MQLRTLLLSLLLASACDAASPAASKDAEPSPQPERPYDTSLTLPLPAGSTVPIPMTSRHGKIAAWVDAVSPETSIEVGLFALAEDESCSTVVEDFEPTRTPTVSREGRGVVAEHDAGRPGAQYCITLTNPTTTEASVTAKIEISAARDDA